jgi:hypothetical protein
LGNDALLVVPCRPQNAENLDIYTHLANFMRMGKEEHIREFWIEVAQKMERRLIEKRGKKLWLSTCGLGIFWLHMRLDSIPKYYSNVKYRNA